MEQKTITKAPIKTEHIELTQKTTDQDFCESRTKEVDLKSLNQAIQELDLGMDFLQKVDATYEKVEFLLYQIKKLASSGLVSDLDTFKHSELKTKISFKKLDITTQLKQRSKILNTLLQEIKQYQDISIENHKAAKSAPDSIAKAEEVLRTINLLT